MPRKTIQKNLAYDTERQLYYAVFRQDGRRYTRTYRTREEAQAALEGNSCADRRLPGKDCTLGEWLTFWLEEVVARDRAESTLYAYRNMGSEMCIRDRSCAACPGKDPSGGADAPAYPGLSL